MEAAVRVGGRKRGQERSDPANFGPLATWVANDGPVSSDWTKKTLGWAPEQIGIVADVERPGYSR